LVGSTARYGAEYVRSGLRSALVALTGVVRRSGAAADAAPWATTTPAMASRARRRPDFGIIQFSPR
jgi:hypothetical protein